MKKTTHNMLTLILAMAVAVLYWHYYDTTVLKQKGLHIDSLWVPILFFLKYGAPFVLAGFFLRRLGRAQIMVGSIMIWLLVYILMFIFKNDAFREIYPTGKQCLIVPITVYPLIGTSMVLGTMIGTSLRFLLNSD